MGKFNDLLNLRFKQKDKKPEQQNKITALAEKSTSGNLSTFAGLFKVTSLSAQEKETIHNILLNYAQKDFDIEQDEKILLSLTAEVKAITNQAVILHGERIKKAQEILKKYQDGAFSAWLVATYGNRQTPYNFLQYYDLFSSMPTSLHKKFDQMPRQAIYTLASRNGNAEKKQEIIRNYSGETKKELLTLIRKIFPLAATDKRLPDIANQVIVSLKKVKDLTEMSSFRPTNKQKQLLSYLLEQLLKKIK